MPIVDREAPIANGGQTGRDDRGRFAKGNPGGPGNPNAAQVAKHRARFYRAIRGSDITLAVETIRSVMKNGRDSDRLTAAKLLLDRALGSAEAIDVIADIEEMRLEIARLQEGG
jgi:hypothetical protein